jgi:hypothetical protein
MVAVSDAFKGLSEPCADQVISFALDLFWVFFPPLHATGVGAKLFHSLMRRLLDSRPALMADCTLAGGMPVAVRLYCIDRNAREGGYPLIASTISLQFINFNDLILCHNLSSSLRTSVLITQWRRTSHLNEKAAKK